MSTPTSQTAVVAVGGNALIIDKKHEDVASQVIAVEETCKHIANMIERGWNVVVTHGNGPQVGFILRRNELSAGEVHQTPLDVIGADTQGAIGYMIARALDNEFTQRKIQRSVAAVVTQVVVDGNDPGFVNPTKGIGGFTTEEKARQFEKEGWMVQEDAGRGWRRMIASPMPLKIVEKDAIHLLIDADFVVVAVGGGGIPVVEDENGLLKGVFAVIDKDRASSLLAADLNARSVTHLHSSREGGAELQQAQPDVAGQDHPQRGQEVLRRRPLPVRQHGSEDRGYHRLPGSQPQRPRPYHRPTPHRRRPGRQDRHLDRSGLVGE